MQDTRLEAAMEVGDDARVLCPQGERIQSDKTIRFKETHPLKAVQHRPLDSHSGPALYNRSCHISPVDAGSPAQGD